jgi:signal transduction histidine kinase
MIFDPDGSIRALNETYLRMWGDKITLEDIRNWNIREDQQMIKGGVVEGLGRAFTGEFVNFPPMLYDPQLSPLKNVMGESAGPKWIQAVAYPVKNTAGELREVICVLEDITARKLAEENLRRSREERLAELEKVRSRIATDLHDDIGASLTQIAILSEVAQAQGEKGNGASAKPLLKISEVSNELVGTMSDIVWSINPAKDHLSDLSQRMRRFASDVLSARGIHVQFSASDADREITINTNLRREVFLIFKESVNNIAKHSGAKQVEIILEISGDNLRLKITDDGKGFSLEASMGTGLTVATDTGGNGIMSMQKRAAEMNGEIEIISDFGRGTIINLRLPLEDRVSPLLFKMKDAG